MAKVKTKHQCEKCLNWFSAKAGNYKRHIKVCDGNYKKPLNGICPHCKEDVGTAKNVLQNHIIYWCKSNPNQPSMKNRSGKQLNTPEAIEKRRKSISKAHKDGKYVHVYEILKQFQGQPHTEKTLDKLSKWATKRNIEIQKKGGLPGFRPRINPDSIPYIEEFAYELGITDLKHGLNGGEFYIEKPDGKGYYAVDGYSEEKNIVIEFQEKEHKKPYKMEEDKIKREYIIETLNMKQEDYHYIWE